MMQDTILVDFVREVTSDRSRSTLASGRIRVAFASGAVVQLDASNARERVWADVLESLRTSRAPAYLEFDSTTRQVISLLLPRVYRVLAMQDSQMVGDVELELEPSHAVHYLRRRHPRFDELHKLLDTARHGNAGVLITESLDDSGIIDVRPAKSGK